MLYTIVIGGEQLYNEQDILIKICWLYYLKQRTQQQIASQFNISRIRVQRLLTEAKEKGIVKFSIAQEKYNLLSLEEEFKINFNIDDIVIIPSDSTLPVPVDDKELKKDLAEAARIYLEDKLNRYDYIGIGMGDTLRYFADKLTYQAASSNKDIRVISLFGNLLPNASVNPYSIGYKISEKLNAKFYGLWAPAKVDSEELASAVKQQKLIKDVFLMMDKIQLSIIGIGNINTGIIRKFGLVSEKEFNSLLNEKAVGEILGYWFNIEGFQVLPELGRKIIGATVKLPGKTLAIAGGMEKVDSIFGALMGNLIDILITDEKTARAVIEIENRKPLKEEMLKNIP